MLGIYNWSKYFSYQNAGSTFMYLLKIQTDGYFTCASKEVVSRRFAFYISKLVQMFFDPCLWQNIFMFFVLKCFFDVKSAFSWAQNHKQTYTYTIFLISCSKNIVWKKQKQNYCSNVRLWLKTGWIVFKIK